MITRRLLLGPGAAGPSLARLRPAGAAPMRRARPPAGAAPLVMLDPGHGGKDPGAIGVSGTYEKHVALAAAQELRRQLQADGRYRVELTRGARRVHPAGGPRGDRAARRARRCSSPCTPMRWPTIRCAAPASIRSPTTASDAQTAALARRENAADRFGGPAVPRRLAGGGAHPGQPGAAGDAQPARRGWRTRLVGSFDRRACRCSTNPARHAGFVVLKAADIPSVLVEMGFMSNRQDEAALRRPQHRARVAAAMQRAVDAWFAAGRAAAPAQPTARMAG